MPVARRGNSKPQDRSSSESPDRNQDESFWIGPLLCPLCATSSVLRVDDRIYLAPDILYGRMLTRALGDHALPCASPLLVILSGRTDPLGLRRSLRLAPSGSF